MAAWDQLDRLETIDHWLKDMAAWWPKWSRKKLACAESTVAVIPLDNVIPVSLSGERLVLPELDQFAWAGRQVNIVPDSDAWSHKK